MKQTEMWPERYSKANQMGPKHKPKEVCLYPKSTGKQLEAIKVRKGVEEPRTKDGAMI